MEAVPRKSQPIDPARRPPSRPRAEAHDREVRRRRRSRASSSSARSTSAFEGKKIARSVAGDTLVLDLGGVKKISSFGIREWVDFIATAGEAGASRSC